MRKFIVLAAAASVASIPSAANATVTLIMGNNGLTNQIHLDSSFNNSGQNIVHGLTQTGNVQVSFTSTSLIDGTSGNGYAQIQDSTVSDNVPWTNLTIFLTNGGGFTSYEFSIDYAAQVVGNGRGQQPPPAFLTIGWDTLGGNSGSFTFDPNDPVLRNLMFTNSANTDFRLDATGADVLAHIYLTSTLPIFEEKQNDITVAPAPPPPPPGVPEPATWAMMIAGFGATGFALRRGKRRKALLEQIA
jgi:hypothetical protein